MEVMCQRLIPVLPHSPVIAIAAHFVYAYLRVCPTADDSVSFTIPTGAAGHLTAAIMVKLCGLPIARIIAATNENGTAHVCSVQHRMQRHNHFALALAICSSITAVADRQCSTM